jgi:hypothetical protein
MFTPYPYMGLAGADAHVAAESPSECGQRSCVHAKEFGVPVGPDLPRGARLVDEVLTGRVGMEILAPFGGQHFEMDGMHFRDPFVVENRTCPAVPVRQVYVGEPPFGSPPFGSGCLPLAGERRFHDAGDMAC